MKIVDDGALSLLDYEPATDTFREEVLAGLSAEPKRAPYKFFYDQRGSQLFDRICELDEYYLTRTELQIMRDHGADMARHLQRGCRVVEYGSGSSLKTRILLDHLDAPSVYVPIDISRQHLLATARKLNAEYPRLRVQPVCADYTQRFTLPVFEGPVGRTVVYFPGSTIGNFTTAEAAGFLSRIAHVVGSRGGLLIGVDLKKDPAILVPAYDDAQGVTAAFNLNLLIRINRELGGDFDLSRFRHVAFWDEAASRIVIQIESLAEQTVSVGGHRFALGEGERITTEYSHKYSLEQFARLGRSAGFEVEEVWMDPRQLFSVQLLTLA